MAIITDVVTPLPLGQFHCKGYVGERLDPVLQARILSDFARDEILAETTEAFRARVDDRMDPDVGHWQGEFWGKWILSAIAAYRYTGSAKLRNTIEAATREVMATQDADGYLGTYHDSKFLHSRGSHCWNVWCRKYTLWGLLAVYELIEDPAILNSAIGMTDHLISEVGPGKAAMIETGRCFGLPSTSILTPIVRLYRLTGEQRFLDYARYIVDQWSCADGPPDLFRNALHGEPIHRWYPDGPRWVKAYEFVSCVEGLLELYRATGEEDDLTAVLQIHQSIREYERLLIGGISDDDHMARAPLKPELITEVCDAVYWVRLNAQLLRLTGEALYADEIERTLYNCLCTASKQDGTWGLRRLALSGAHHISPKHSNLKHHQCCVANLPRGFLQAIEHAILLEPDGIRLNLYLPGGGTISSAATGEMNIAIETQYPLEDEIQIRIDTDSPRAFTIKFRIPPWAEGATVYINEETHAGAPGQYLAISKTWSKTDEIRVRLPLHARMATLQHDNCGYVAVERGPLVLARDIRLGDGDIHAPVSLSAEHLVALASIDVPAGITAAWACADATGTPVRFCNYSSAGSTWDVATSDFRVWMPVA